jgi:hypothetical protein
MLTYILVADPEAAPLDILYDWVTDGTGVESSASIGFQMELGSNQM